MAAAATPVVLAPGAVTPFRSEIFEGEYCYCIRDAAKKPKAKPSPKARKKQGTAAGGESEYEAGSEQDAELGKLFFEGKRRVVQLQWQVIHIYV